MDYRRKKQAIIVSILALVLVLILTGAYYKWFYQRATCFDNKQNQNEGGVDCGGSCAMSCEILTVKKLEVEWVKAIFLKDGVYDLAAKITNPNPNFGLEKFDYVFSLFDADNQLLAKKEGSSFVLPNQAKYLVEVNIALAVRPAKAELVIAEPVRTNWRRLRNGFQAPDMYVHDKQFKILGSEEGAQLASAQVSGIIKNNSDFDFDKVSLAVLLFDAKKEIVGVNRTEAYTIPAGEERYFSVLWFSPFNGEVKSMDVLADTNLFSDSNFMKRYSEPEKFQEY